MDLITNIEENGIFRALLEIQHSLTPTPGEYNPYSSTGEVKIDDQILATETLVTNHNITLPEASYLINYDVEQTEPEIGDEMDIGQNVYTNVLYYDIIAHVTLKGDEEHSTRKTKIRMNEILSDLKWVFGKHYDLYKNCEYIEYVSGGRIENYDDDILNTAKLKTTWKIVYTQSIFNPNIMGCN